MSGLVDQLQAEAMDKSVPLSTLLRNAKLAAVKLKLSDAVGWIDAELGGHSPDSVPDYRRVIGMPMMNNFGQGWVPLRTHDEVLTKLMSTMPIREPITSLEETLKEPSPTFIQPFNAGVLHAVSKIFGGQVSAVGLQVGRGVLVGILEHVRNRVFDWALDLELAGITGQGISFSPAEKVRAAKALISIGTMHGNLNTGDVIGANSRINQGSTDSSTNIAGDHAVFGEIEQAVCAQVADPAAREEILAANREMQMARDRPSLLDAYNRFMASAADHMGVILPLLPALTGIVMGGGG